MIRRCLIIAVCVLLTRGLAFGQGVGTASPFEFGFGSRDLALGGASIARSDFTTAPFWNASHLAHAEHMQVSLFHSRLFDSDVGYQYFGAVAPTLDFGTFGIGVARLGVDGIEKRDAGNVLLGSVSDSRLALYFAYGRAVAGYDVGLTVSFEHHSLDGYSATSSPGLDLSVSREIPISAGWIRDATLTVRGSNLIRPQMDLAAQRLSYPVLFSGAASVAVVPDISAKHSLQLTGRFDKPESGHLLTAFGAEYSFGPTLQLRGGIRESNPSVGAGLRYRAMQFDYSVVGRDLGSVHTLSLTTSIGLSTADRRQRREFEREQTFSALMNEQLHEQNNALLSSLTEQGDSALSAERPNDAVQYYDRALFVARSHQLDTLTLTQKREDAQRVATTALRDRRYHQYIDSVASTFQRREFISADYYAGLALSEKPGDTQALSWQQRTRQALTERENRDEIIIAELAEIDSLLGYGDIGQATLAAEALVQFAPENTNVHRLVKRAHFESCRSRAISARSRGDLGAAQVLVDSAGVIYPGHQWCREFKATLQPPQTDSKPSSAAKPSGKAPAPSDDMLREARSRYQRGQDLFREGNLPAAIAEWETVERIVPEFESVRSYLVRAYRLVGIDHYGRNNLADAVKTWKRAFELDPADEEIKGFIERTEAEIRRLGELSYDQN